MTEQQAAKIIELLEKLVSKIDKMEKAFVPKYKHEEPGSMAIRVTTD